MSIQRIEKEANKVSLYVNDNLAYYAMRENVWMGHLAGGNKLRWIVKSVAKGKSVGKLTGYSKAEAVSAMKRFSKK